MDWKYRPGSMVANPLTYTSGDRGYVISHRPHEFNLTFQSSGNNEHLGTFTSLEEAKGVAEKHSGNWHPYGNPNAQGEPGRKSTLRAKALRSDNSATAELRKLIAKVEAERAARRTSDGH